MIHVTQKEIQRAFRNHQHVVGDNLNNLVQPTYKMTLFYAVECGLKALFMKKHNLKSTKSKNSRRRSVIDFKHDLNELLNEMKIFPQVPKATTANNSQIESKDLHQAWRYGKKLERKEESACIKNLKKILESLKSELY